MKVRWQFVLAGLGAVAVVYSMVVLGFVATIPDIGIRCLMDDSPWENGVSRRGRDPDACRQEVRLRARGRFPKLVTGWSESAIGPSTRLSTLPKPSCDCEAQSVAEASRSILIPLNAKHASGCPSLWQDIKMGLVSWRSSLFPLPAARSKTATCYLQVQSLPVTEVLVFASLVRAAGDRFCHRRGRLLESSLRPRLATFLRAVPCDAGGVLGQQSLVDCRGSFWLTAPSLICTMLLPAVCLHFFLVFPRTWLPLVWRPRTSLALIYGLPVVGTAVLLTLAAICSWLPWRGVLEPDVATIRQLLAAIRIGIYVSLVVGGVYFVIALACVQRSYATTRNAVEQIQLKLLWRAGLVTTLCMIMVLYLALFEREKFALGWARYPIFLAGLCFTVAYAYGIIRYRLLLVDQIVSKGVMYYLASSGLTAAFALTIALSPIARQYLNIFPLTQQSALISIVLMLAVILLLWFRDAIQRTIDRRFFREKYQLGKALERMNRAVGHLADPEAVAELMLGSCRDVLGVDRAALYLRTSAESPFRLVAAYGAESLPRQFAEGHPLIEAVKELGNLQRALLGARGESAAAQNALRELRIELVHGLQIGNQTVGLVVLGGKQNSAPFSGEDLTFLNALGQITNVALYTVKSDRDLERLNDELIRKIERIELQSRQIAVLQTELSQLQNPAPAETAAEGGRPEPHSIKGKERRDRPRAGDRPQGRRQRVVGVYPRRERNGEGTCRPHFA